VRITKPWQLTTEQWLQFHRFLGIRLAEAYEQEGRLASVGDRFLRPLRIQAEIHGDLIRYRDHSLDVQDAGFIDGLGLALRHAAVHWADHPDYLPAWVPPQGDPMNLLEYNYR